MTLWSLMHLLIARYYPKKLHVACFQCRGQHVLLLRLNIFEVEFLGK